MRPEDLPLPPPPAEPDRHFEKADPRADRPDAVEFPSLSNAPPALFLHGVDGVKEGYEEIEKFLRLETNAQWETDIDRRLAALLGALDCAERIKGDPNAADVLEFSLGTLYGNLGAAILHRRTHSYRENKEEALKYFGLAIAHFERKGEIDNVAKTHSNIALALSQGMSSDDFADIPLCLSHLREALRLYESTGWIPPEVRLNFASFALRGQGSRRAENIAEAVRLLGPLTTPSYRKLAAEYWASAQTALAALLFATEGRRRRETWLAAIAATERALEVRTRSEKPDQWAVSTQNLVEMRAAYAEVFQDAAAPLDPAPYLELIDYWTASGREIRAASTSRTLAHRLLMSTSDAPESHRDRLLGEARRLLERALEVFSPDASADEFVETAVRLFHVLVRQRSFEEAAAMGLKALRVSQSLEEAGADLERIQSVSSRVRSVGSEAALLYALSGDPAHALECVEIGRARFLRASLHLGRTKAEYDQESLALRAQMRGLEREIRTSGQPAALEKIEKLNQLRRAFLDKLVERPGGIGEPPLAQLETILTNYDALVWLVFCPIGACVIVAAPASGSAGPNLFAAPLEATALDSEDSLSTSWARESVAARGLNAGNEAGAAQWRETIANIGGRLWTDVLQHVTRVLYNRSVQSGRIVLLPPGELAILPLGLAGDAATRTPLLERFEVSIAPTLSALSPSPGQGRRPWSLGAVVNPSLNLPFTAIEAARSIQAFPEERRAVVFAADSTLAATRTALEGKTHWLLSTHGAFEPSDPRQSRIELAGGEALTLDALLSTDRAATPRLVILSACETGLQDLRTAPDEFVGFPTAFLQLGAGGVIASLWPVNDASTALLISRFFACHVQEGLRPAAALRRAQLWLRDATVAQIKKEMAELQAGLARVKDGGETPAQIDQLFADLPRTGKPFQHPYYWGGFVMFGR